MSAGMLPSSDNLSALSSLIFIYGALDLVADGKPTLDFLGFMPFKESSTLMG